MNTTRLAVSIIGVYAGLLGALHGYFELLQGSTVPESLVINAIGAPCQPETVAHACFPALTVLPGFQLAGILTIVLSGAAAVWAVAFITRRWGALVLFLLALGMLLVGGGFLPPLYAVLAAAASTQINPPAAWWQRRLPGGVLRGLAALWPGLLGVYLAWIVLQTVFSEALNAFLLSTGGILLPVELVALLLALLSAIAHDVLHAEENSRAG